MKPKINYSSILFIIVGLLFNISIYSIESTPKSLNFFYDSKLNPQLGLSCKSESECKNTCPETNNCQKPVTTCLNCIGSRSVNLNNFFNNISELTTACLDQGFITNQSEELFNNVSMVPIFPISPYNPLGLKDFQLMLKFMSLCPAGTIEPIAIAFTDTITHAISDIPIVKCGNNLFPLVKMGEDCAEKADKILNIIDQEKRKNTIQQNLYKDASQMADALPIKYDILPFSNYTEAQYIGCNDISKAVCNSLCHSSLSCTFPINNLTTAKAIATFNQNQFTSCGMMRFSIDILRNYLSDPTAFAFNSLSLNQSYDIPTNVSNSDFKDLSVINSILQTYAGIFKAVDFSSDSSFILSDAYQKILDTKMRSLCDAGENPFILGHNDKIELIYCQSGINGYFKTLSDQKDNCSDKLINQKNIGVVNEK